MPLILSAARAAERVHATQHRVSMHSALFCACARVRARAAHRSQGTHSCYRCALATLSTSFTACEIEPTTLPTGSSSPNSLSCLQCSAVQCSAAQCSAVQARLHHPLDRSAAHFSTRGGTGEPVRFKPNKCGADRTESIAYAARKANLAQLFLSDMPSCSSACIRTLSSAQLSCAYVANAQLSALCFRAVQPKLKLKRTGRLLPRQTARPYRPCAPCA
jgi:hypothetical protein